MIRLFLDDLRNPPDDGGSWLVARTNEEAMWFCEGGAPDFVSLDHDLGGDDRAIDFVKWLIEQDLDQPGFIPIDFGYTIHSANPIGAANMRALLDRYLEFRRR
jgi:hypothetical protein